jgi:hypothetical protein
MVPRLRVDNPFSGHWICAPVGGMGSRWLRHRPRQHREMDPTNIVHPPGDRDCLKVGGKINLLGRDPLREWPDSRPSPRSKTRFYLAPPTLRQSPVRAWASGYREVRLPDPRSKRIRTDRAPAKATQERTDQILREAGSLHGRHGGVRRGSSLGPRADRPRTQGEADRPRGGQALREERKERCRRRGSDLRGRIPS